MNIRHVGPNLSRASGQNHHMQLPRAVHAHHQLHGDVGGAARPCDDDIARKSQRLQIGSLLRRQGVAAGRSAVACRRRQRRHQWWAGVTRS
jgi:hypothetical protein